MGLAVADQERRWPGGIIPYVVDPSFTERNQLFAAMKEWESGTNIRFVERQGHTTYLRVMPHADACNSKVGRIGGEQRINCAPLPSKQRAYIHEIGHAVGLVHEHQRQDRDRYVAVDFSNVKPGKVGNFRIRENTVAGCEYDYASVMHYGPKSHAVDSSKPTLVAVGGQKLTGSKLSTLDKAFVNCLYPNVGVVRRGDSTDDGAGAASEVAIAGVIHDPSDPAQPVVCAVRTAEKTLRLIQFKVHEQLGGVMRVNDSGTQAGEASHISIAQGITTVTAVRTRSGRLKLINWSVDGSGISRLGDSGDAAGQATQINIMRLTSRLFVVACRTREGSLRLITWRTRADGSVVRLADSGDQAGAVVSISMDVIARSGSTRTMATTVRTPTQGLKIIAWRISTASGSIERIGDSGGSMGDGTQVATVQPSSGFLVVSCRTADSDHRLKLITYSIQDGGTVLTRVADSADQAGRISANALMSRPYGLISAVTDGSGRLKLIKWLVNPGGALLRFGDSGDRAAGTASRTALQPVRLARDSPVLTAVIGGGGKLKLITWDDESKAGELQR